jgi:hypothetical protein
MSIFFIIFSCYHHIFKIIILGYQLSTFPGISNRAENKGKTNEPGEMKTEMPKTLITKMLLPSPTQLNLKENHLRYRNKPKFHMNKPKRKGLLLTTTKQCACI